MMAGEKLVELMKTAGRNGIPATERTDIVYGTVQSTEPLVIALDKDPKMRLTETFLYLSPLCKRKTFTIPQWNAVAVSQTTNPDSHSHDVTVSNPYSGSGTTSSETHSHGIPAHGHTINQHTVEVWRGLRSGDRVVMLRCASGGMYYVLQREGDL